MVLPAGQLGEFGEGCAFGPPDQRQDFRALALGARRGWLALGRGLGFGGFLGLAPLAVFWPLGAPFFWLAPFFEGAFSGATCAPCSATVAAVVGFCVGHLVLVSFSALRLRMTIHHSGPLGNARQL